jgi:hypothetical protein
MKKFILSTACGLALVATTAFAGPTLVEAITQLNNTVEKILLPYQDAQTQARIEFKNIQTDTVRALQAKLNAFFFKTGPGNTLTLKIDDLSYDYGNGQTPTTNLEGSFALDITKVLPQSDLNDLIENLEATIKDLTADYIKDYGNAVTITANVTDKTKNANGDYVTVKADLTVAIDLAQLPADKKAEDIPLTFANAKLELDVNKGIFVKAQVVSNPTYKGFQQGELGLKEALDLLLAQDPATMQQIQDLVKQINDIATDLVK